MKLKKTKTELRVLFIHYARLLLCGLNLKEIAFLEGVSVSTLNTRLMLAGVSIGLVKKKLKSKMPAKPVRAKKKPAIPVQKWSRDGIKDGHPGNTVSMFGGRFAQ